MHRMNKNCKEQAIVQTEMVTDLWIKKSKKIIIGSKSFDKKLISGPWKQIGKKKEYRVKK